MFWMKPTIKWVSLAAVVVFVVIAICLYRITWSPKNAHPMHALREDLNTTSDTDKAFKTNGSLREALNTTSDTDNTIKANGTQDLALNVFKASLERYKSFHNEAVMNMSHHSDLYHVRTLTWACSSYACGGGLGDQLFRINFALLLAMISDRVFVISWDQNLRRKTRYIQPNEINWDIFDSSAGMCSADEGNGGRCNGRVYGVTSPWGFGWSEKEHERFGQVIFGSEKHITLHGNLIVNIMFIGDHSMLKVGKLLEEGFDKLGVTTILNKGRYNQVMYYRLSPDYADLERRGLLSQYEIQPMNNGRVQATDSFQLVNHVIFHYLFKFTADLLSQVEQIKMTLQISKQPYLAVHLRTGFVGSSSIEHADYRDRYFKNWKLFHESVWPCIMNHSINLADRMIGVNASVYLATDSPAAKDLAKRLYGNRFRTSPLVPFHFAHNAQNSDDSSSWVDFLLLGGSAAMIHGDSSFAVNAAFLTPIPMAKQSWIIEDKNKGCMVSHIENNTACIC